MQLFHLCLSKLHNIRLLLQITFDETIDTKMFEISAVPIVENSTGLV